MQSRSVLSGYPSPSPASPRAPLPLSVCSWLADTVACIDHAHFDHAHRHRHRHPHISELSCGFNNCNDFSKRDQYVWVRTYSKHLATSLHDFITLHFSVVLPWTCQLYNRVAHPVESQQPGFRFRRLLRLFQHIRCWAESVFFTDHFIGPGRAVGSVCLRLCRENK